MRVQRWVAVLLAAFGIGALTGTPAWPMLLVAVALAVMPLPGAAYAPQDAVDVVAVVRDRIGRVVAALASWPAAQRVSVLLVPLGIALTAVGVGMWAGPGPGVAAAGITVGLLGLQLERRPA